MKIIGLYGYHDGTEMKELRERVKSLIINHYRTPNNDLVYDRLIEYKGLKRGHGTKNYNVNKITFFKDIPDDVEILIDYVVVTAIRTMNIPREIIYESIYMELPELLEE